MLNKIYIHYITTLFVLESFIISCWLLKGKKIGIGIGIGQFARKKSVSESATKNHDRCITNKYLYIMQKGLFQILVHHWSVSQLAPPQTQVIGRVRS